MLPEICRVMADLGILYSLPLQMMSWIFFFWNVVSSAKRKLSPHPNVYFPGHSLGIETVSDRLKKLERNNTEKP